MFYYFDSSIAKQKFVVSSYQYDESIHIIIKKLRIINILTGLLNYAWNVEEFRHSMEGTSFCHGCGIYGGYYSIFYVDLFSKKEKNTISDFWDSYLGFRRDEKCVLPFHLRSTTCVNRTLCEVSNSMPRVKLIFIEVKYDMLEATDLFLFKEQYLKYREHPYNAFRCIKSMLSSTTFNEVSKTTSVFILKEIIIDEHVFKTLNTILSNDELLNMVTFGPEWFYY